jgi:hypothetical protein
MFEIIVTYLCLDHQYPDISNFQGQTRSYGQCYKTFIVVIDGDLIKTVGS